jgi:Flp pilus assembly protein TadD
MMTRDRVQVWRDPVALWSDALERAPVQGRVFRELADSYVRRGDGAGAARVVAAEAFALERAVKAAPRDADLLVGLGKSYALLGRISEALAVAHRAVKLAPTDPSARAELGALLLAQADANGAVAQLEIAAALVEGRGRRIDPDTARAVWTNLGWAYASLGRSQDALRVLRRAAEGDDVTALNGLGSILGLVGEWDEARQVLERANAKDPTNPSVQRNLGWVYANLGRFAEANALLERAIVRAPDEPRAHGSLGWVRLRSGRPAGALDALSMAAELEPDNPNVAIMLGVARAQLGEWDDATRAFARAVQLAPNMPLARENLNRARLRQPPILPQGQF